MRMWYGGAAAVVSLWLLVGAALAQSELPEVRFLGMHSSQAKLSVNRRSYTLSPGETIKGRLTLISATRSEVIVGIDEQVLRYAKGAKRGEVLPREMILERDSIGMFETVGAINGVPTPFLIDTGATFVSMSASHAKRMRLKYSKKRPISIQTASKVEKAFLITLDSVRLGGIVRFDVPAVVMPGTQPDVPLLGNSFLGSLSISQKNEYLLLSDE